MGGATVLEYPLNTPPGFVRAIIPLATSARHSAWGISWGEAQRQSIYSDPEYKDGYYFETENGQVDLALQPSRGLAAARMAALLTYRSRDSFESRFGRRTGVGGKSKVPKGGVRIMGGPETTDPAEPSEADLAKSPRLRAWREHNDGHRSSTLSRRGSDLSSKGDEDGISPSQVDPKKGDKVGTGADKPQKIFSAQSYLRYQGDKVRFDIEFEYEYLMLMDSLPVDSTQTVISTSLENSTRMICPTPPSSKISAPSLLPFLRPQIPMTMKRSRHIYPTLSLCYRQHWSLVLNPTVYSPHQSKRRSQRTFPMLNSSLSLHLTGTMDSCWSSRRSMAGSTDGFEEKCHTTLRSLVVLSRLKTMQRARNRGPMVLGSKRRVYLERQKQMLRDGKQSTKEKSQVSGHGFIISYLVMYIEYNVIRLSYYIHLLLNVQR